MCPLFFQLGTGNTLANLYESVGFSEVESVRINTVMRYHSDDDALNAVFAGGPVAMAYSRFDEATKKAVHEEYLNSIAGYKNNEGYFIPGEFVVVKGEKG